MATGQIWVGKRKRKGEDYIVFVCELWDVTINSCFQLKIKNILYLYFDPEIVSILKIIGIVWFSKKERKKGQQQ